VKIVLAKLGLDDHTRPLHVLAQGFRDAGMEVVFLGTHNTPAQVVGVALQEDVDAVVLSFHTLGHVGWLAEVVELLRERGGVGRVAVFAGGVIPSEDAPMLAAMGVRGLHGAGTPMVTITEDVRRAVEELAAERARARSSG
jgi:methylmalonyl-CoA mutase C-terminal domain/subunit